MAGSSFPTSPPPRYTLPNDWDLAGERLALLGEAYDAESVSLATRLGVGVGSRCLEAGAGGGSFARWLCSAVLPGGRVLAVDADPRHLADLPARGGEIAQFDLVADELPPSAFDFVHTRFVLLHIAERDEVLRRLARTLPARLAKLGLIDIHSTAEIPMFRGGSPTARMWSLTAVQVQESLVGQGVSAEVIAAARAELTDEGRWFYAPPTVRAWARAPRML
ncbi:class I SAM-dependent methyltransferase [Nocardia yamanashiensis]|uniref:class I SAM-dependent methyltransferase n=1 Tax=Nocardia yamanashiensis TaxID=209247 RepID=UPI000A01D599|nr:class I SAM-dependent methyltransferase [Nocardia yamanashiensis]